MIGHYTTGLRLVVLPGDTIALLFRGRVPSGDPVAVDENFGASVRRFGLEFDVQ